MGAGGGSDTKEHNLVQVGAWRGARWEQGMVAGGAKCQWGSGTKEHYFVHAEGSVWRLRECLLPVA